jgi:hypothetical protein
MNQLLLREALELADYFTSTDTLVFYILCLQRDSYIDKNKEKIKRVKDVLHEGLILAQKFGCTEEDARKCKNYSGVYVTFITSRGDSWLMDADKEAPIVFWEKNGITFMLSEQRLQWLDSYAQCMFGIIGPDGKVFPNKEDLEAHLKKMQKIPNPNDKRYLSRKNL